MDQIKYPFGNIAAAAADIRATAGSMNALLDDLKQQLRPMVSTWEGDSASAYQTAQAKWDSAAAELNTILETIASTVQEGNDRMSEVNRMAAASWG